MPGAMRRQRQAFDIWPGFVDALSALLIIIIFLLMVFTLAQFFLSEILSGRNQALERLNRQVAELSEVLSLERSTNARLREDLSRLATDLQVSTTAREELSSQLAELLPQRDALQAKLGAARETISAEKAKNEAQLAEIAQINRDIKALQDVRAELEKKVSQLATTVVERDKSITSLRDQSKELEAKLAGEQERTTLAQKKSRKKSHDPRVERPGGADRRRPDQGAAGKPGCPQTGRNTEQAAYRPSAAAGPAKRCARSI